MLLYLNISHYEMSQIYTLFTRFFKSDIKSKLLKKSSFFIILQLSRCDNILVSLQGNHTLLNFVHSFAAKWKMEQKYTKLWAQWFGIDFDLSLINVNSVHVQMHMWMQTDQKQLQKQETN